MSWTEELHWHAQKRLFRTNLPGLASFCVVHNEDLFLLEHLLYHRSIGVKRAYIFLDRCTDRSEAIARSCSWVEVIPMDRDTEQMPRNIFQQLACAAIALNMARRDGIEWLLHLDPDEFAVGRHQANLSLTGHAARSLGIVSKLEAEASLPAMLGEVAPEIEQIILAPREVAPVHYDESKPFWQHAHFQIDRPICREILNPVTQKMGLLDRWMGHPRGKSIIRTNADVQAYDSHEWTRAQSGEDAELQPIPTLRVGYHYHYAIISGSHWKDKYTKFSEEPDYWRHGNPMPFPRVVWKHACLSFTIEEAEEYFHKWVCLQPDTMAQATQDGLLVFDSRPGEMISRSLRRRAKCAPCEYPE